MKKNTVKSSMSNHVVHGRIGVARDDATQPDAAARKKQKVVHGLSEIEEDAKRWDQARAQRRLVSGETSLAALHAQDTGEDPEAGSGLGNDDDGAEGSAWQDVEMDDPFPRIYLSAIQPQQRRGKSSRSPYVRFVQPAVPFRRYDPRTWKERIQATQKAWSNLLPRLTDAFIAWRAASETAPSASPSTDEPPPGPAFFVHVVREYEFIINHRVVVENEGTPHALALVHAGLLPSTPIDPTVAVSLDLLDFYYRLRRHCPRLGVQQFVKALCDRHERTYHRHLRDQFADAFDAYLAILREVETRVKVALGRTAPHWRVQNSCAACRYKLKDEPHLVIPALVATDGNFSLKRSAAAGTAEPRVYVSDYKVPNEDVERYANEVKSRQRIVPGSEDADTGVPRVEQLDEPGEPGDDAPPTPCTLRWKAAKADAQKIALDIFDQTGIYMSLCRHGMVVYYCEMRKSGELAKYPLSVYARIMEAELTPLDAAGDIGCALDGTLARSPKLGALARAKGLKIRMNSFHGYGHNRLCQLTAHPLFIDGFGLEDLEVCERFFSASNHVAPLVRHATHFHYSQFYDIFLYAWDEEKYAALSTFICDNIRQAYGIIDDFEPVLEQFKSTHGFTDNDIDSWRHEERAYLEALKKEPEEDQIAMDYVVALAELERAQTAAAASNLELVSGFINVRQEDLSNLAHGDVAKRLTKKRKAHDVLSAAIANVAALEQVLKVQVRWTPESAEYKATIKKIQQRDFMRAVDRLEYLVLQRMFELSKTHAFGTGYRMREAIGKSIKARSKAIGTAVKKYNDAAAAVVPPAPAVDFARLMEWTELQEFNLLRLARRGDVREREWAKPANREAAVKFHKVRRAKEELTRCEVELRRLVTSIRDEDAELQRTRDQLVEQENPIATEVDRLRRKRAAVNAEHMQRIVKFVHSKGMARFKRCLQPGTREGTESSPANDPTTPTPTTSATSQRLQPTVPELEDEDDEQSGESGNELDDEQAEQVGFVQDFIGQLES